MIKTYSAKKEIRTYKVGGVGISGLAMLLCIVWPTVVRAVPRDIVVHRDGTKVEGSIVSETAEEIILDSKYGKLHFRKADLAQVQRGVDPDAQQTTAPVESPTYDYRVYIPEGPIDPERPAKPIVIAELIRRGLTPPPATPTIGGGTPGESRPAMSTSFTPTPEASEPTPLAAATVQPVVLVTPSPSPQAVPVQRPEEGTRLTMPTPTVPPAATPFAVTPAPTVLAMPLPTQTPQQVVTPVATPIETPSLQMTSSAPTQSASSAAPLAETGSLLEALLASAKAVPTASSAVYVGGGTPSTGEAKNEAVAQPGTSVGQDVIASVTEVRGVALLKRGGTVQTLARGTSISQGDTIQTGRDSLVAIRLREGIGVVIGGESEVTFAKPTGANVAEIGVLQGLVWCSAEGAAAKSVGVAAAGCMVSPDPSDLGQGYTLKVASVTGGRILVASLRGRALLVDSVLDVVLSIEAQKPAYYLPGSRRVEEQAQLLPGLQKELETVNVLVGGGR